MEEYTRTRIHARALEALKRTRAQFFFSEGAKFRREQIFGGSKTSEGGFYFGTNTIVHMWEGQMCIWWFTQKAWFGRECWREFSVMANLAL